MKAASAPRPSSALRILVSSGGGMRVARADDIASVLCPGDVVVVNDAATLPASIDAQTEDGAPVELRLLAARYAPGAFSAALLGRGDHTTRTEDRPPPPRVRVGERLVSRVDRGVFADVCAVSPISARMVDVTFRTTTTGDPPAAAIWSALYRVGKPVQYAHVPARLALRDVQNAYAARPWAVEMPSAGRALRIETILALRAAGVAVVAITHAAGISSTGDPAIDALLPLPERFDVPPETAAAINAAHSRGGRVIAVGTSVVRALESAAVPAADQLPAARTPSPSARVVAAVSGVTDLHLAPGSPRRVVDALLTGVHDRGTSHFALLGAFASASRLEAALARSEREGLLGHELGDAWLLWADDVADVADVHDADEVDVATRPVACGCLDGATLPAA